MGAACETALASSTKFIFQMESINIHEAELKKGHAIIVIKFDMSGFKVLGELTSCFARALVHCDNKSLQNRSQSLNLHSFKSVGWNHLIHSQTATVAPLKFGNG